MTLQLILADVAAYVHYSSTIYITAWFIPLTSWKTIQLDYKLVSHEMFTNPLPNELFFFGGHF